MPSLFRLLVAASAVAAWGAQHERAPKHAPNKTATLDDSAPASDLTGASALDSQPTPAPSHEDLVLHAPDVATVRDKIVAWFEDTITHMNASSICVSDVLVREVVAAMQNATWVELGNGDAIGGNSSTVHQSLGPNALAQAQGELVNHINYAIGHMNGTSVIRATDLVRDLVASMEDKTGIAPSSLVLLPGRPPPHKEAPGKDAPNATAADDEDGANATLSNETQPVLALARPAGSGRSSFGYALVALGCAALLAGGMSARGRARFYRDGEDDGAVHIAMSDELSSSNYAAMSDSSSAALLARQS